MKVSAKRLPIIGCLITLLLGSQLGLAAEMMDRGMSNDAGMAPAITEQSTKHPTDDNMKDSMGGKRMDEGMDKSQEPMTKMSTMHPEEVKTNQGMSMKRVYTVPNDTELRKSLTPLQYRVTRKGATEPAYKNAYWDNHEPGLYVDVISGVPLFSSTDKYDSGTGWPSFTRPIDSDAIIVKEDRSFFFMVRNEVRSKLSDAHLGHVFDDGPQPTGLRYCMNSAALRFVPVADLEKEGYGDYVSLFK